MESSRDRAWPRHCSNFFCSSFSMDISPNRTFTFIFAKVSRRLISAESFWLIVATVCCFNFVTCSDTSCSPAPTIGGISFFIWPNSGIRWAGAFLIVLGREINLSSVLSSGFPWWFITTRMGVGGRKRSAFNSDGAKHSKINTDSIKRVGAESVSQCTKTAVPSFDPNSCSTQADMMG